MQIDSQLTGWKFVLLHDGFLNLKKDRTDMCASNLLRLARYNKEITTKLLVKAYNRNISQGTDLSFLYLSFLEDILQ